MELLLAIPLLLGAAALIDWGTDEVAEAEPETEPEDRGDLLHAPLRLSVSDALGTEIEGRAEDDGTHVTAGRETILVFPGASPEEVDARLAALDAAGAFAPKG